MNRQKKVLSKNQIEGILARLDQMRAHVDNGGALSITNSTSLLALAEMLVVVLADERNIPVPLNLGGPIT